MHVCVCVCCTGLPPFHGIGLRWHSPPCATTFAADTRMCVCARARVGWYGWPVVTMFDHTLVRCTPTCSNPRAAFDALSSVWRKLAVGGGYVRVPARSTAAHGASTALPLEGTPRTRGHYGRGCRSQLLLGVCILACLSILLLCWCRRHGVGRRGHSRCRC